MGIESMLKNMNPKRKRLLENLFVIGFIITIAYAFLTIGKHGGNVMAFMQSSDFTTIVILLIFTFFGWKLINTGKLNIPQQGKKQQPRKRPQTTPKQRQQPHLSITPKQTKTSVMGATKCPRCGNLIVKQKCSCGYIRK